MTQTMMMASRLHTAGAQVQVLPVKCSAPRLLWLNLSSRPSFFISVPLAFSVFP